MLYSFAVIVLLCIGQRWRTTEIFINLARYSCVDALFSVTEKQIYVGQIAVKSYRNLEDFFAGGRKIATLESAFFDALLMFFDNGDLNFIGIFLYKNLKI